MWYPLYEIFSRGQICRIIHLHLIKLSKYDEMKVVSSSKNIVPLLYQMSIVKQVNRYRLWCVTENANVYTWSDSLPIQCPNNSGHVIDGASCTIIDSVASDSVSIDQDGGHTNLNYMCRGYSMSIPYGQTVTKDITFPFNISISTVHFTTDSTQTGDHIMGLVAPGTTIGLTTSAVNTGDQSINVSGDVIKYVVIGTLVQLVDTSQNPPVVSKLGTVYQVDAVNNKITCATGSTVAFPKSGVSVQTAFNNIDIVLGPAQTYTLGASQIKAAPIPANTIIRTVYTNNSSGAMMGVTPAPKSFVWYMQLYY